jgi:hypothetical protein
MTSDSKMKVRKTEILTRLSDRNAIEHSLNVIHQISHLIRADKRRTTQFIHRARKLEVLLLFRNDSGLASW